MDDSFEETTPNEQPEDFDGEAEEVDLSADEPEVDPTSEPTMRQSLSDEDESTAASDTDLSADEPPLEPHEEPTAHQSAVVPEYDPDAESTTARPSIYDDVEEEGGGLPIVPIVIGGLAALCGLALVAGAIVMLVLPGLRGGGAASEEPEDVPTPTLERTLVFPTATIGPTEEMAETESVEEETDEAPEDETTPTVEPTATSAPAQPAAPTNPPPPPAPTNTPVPPPPSFDIPGLTGVTFTVPNPVAAVNQRINFNFTVHNEGDESIIFGPLGVAIQDAGGTTLAFHTSWTRWELEPDKTENWADGVTIGDPGSYLLELSACIPNAGDHCDASGGDWYVLAPAIAVTVN